MKRYLSTNVRNYLAALVVLSILATAYRAAENVLLALPEFEAIVPRPPTQDTALFESVADLFPPDAWQLGDCKRLLTQRSTMLFEHAEQLSADQWKLKPLTIVVGRGLSDKSDPAPIILTAPEGAEIEFAGSVEMLSGGGAPPIKMGRMIGDVAIHRDSPDSNEPDVQSRRRGQELDVRTREVWIDNQKIWTIEPISMTVGGAELRGRDLTIYLAKSTTAAARGKTPSAVLDRMDLVYLDELRIPLDRPQPPRLWPRRIGTAAATAPPQSSLSQQRGVVSIECKNRMSYDFGLDRLSLRDDIVLTRTLRGREVDRFECEFLDLTLRDPGDQSLQRDGPLDWVDRINAKGEPVMMDLSERDFRLVADEVFFDAPGGLLEAKAGQGIQVERGSLSARLAAFTYRFDPQRPEQIGEIDVFGNGLISITDPTIALQQFQWDKRLSVGPLAPLTIEAMKSMQTQSKLEFQVDGDIVATMNDGGRFRAAKASGVLKPIYRNRPAAAPSQSIASSRGIVEPTATLERKMIWVPEVINASTAVSVDSEQAAAETNLLRLFFEVAADYGQGDSAKTPATSIAVQPVGQPEVRLANDSAMPAGRFGSGARASSAASRQPTTPAGAGPLRKPVARPRPSLSGDEVVAYLLMTDEGTQIKDVSVKGNVHLQHQVSSGTSVTPVEMFGQTLRLMRGSALQSAGHDYLQLGSGPQSPARLTMGDGFFVGPIIKVWPNENIIKVAGAGELKVPSQVLKNAATRSAESGTAGDRPGMPSNIDWRSAPFCKWGGEMQFDGSIAVLDGGVRIDAELVSGVDPWTTTMTGDKMQISLLRPVRLMEQATFAATEIDAIRMVESADQAVLVRAIQSDSADQQQAIHVITARQLDFKPGGGGGLKGEGPGWYRGWMLTDQNSSPLSPKTTRTEHLGNQVLQGVHLTFRNALVGNLKSETLSFQGGVRTGMRKLRSWQDSVDVDQMLRLSPGEMTMDCDELQFGISPGVSQEVREIPGMPTPWEMTAIGSVIARSYTEENGLFEGTANRASYESQKSWFVAEGNALIRHTRVDGTSNGKTRWAGYAINLKTFEAEGRLKGGFVNDLPIPSKR